MRRKTMVVVLVGFVLVSMCLFGSCSRKHPVGIRKCGPGKVWVPGHKTNVGQWVPGHCARKK